MKRSGGLGFFSQGVPLDHRVEVDLAGAREAAAMSNIDDPTLLQELQGHVDPGVGQAFLASDDHQRGALPLIGRLPDQIAADRYLASKEAAKKRGLGIAMKKLVPPGTD